MLDLTNKTILITGASSGIGYACAQQAAKLGANLILAARRKDRIDELANTCEAEHNIKTHTIQLDVTNHQAVNQAIKSIQNLPDPFSTIDIVLNNAGLAAGLDPIQTADTNDWERMIDTNVKGLLYVTKAILPGMIDRKAGHIINIGSTAGHEVYPNGSVYCATKHAVNVISRGLKMDVNDHGIRVSSIDPGLVETEFSVVRFHGDQNRADSVYKGMKPLTADDVADAVIYAATRPAHVNISEIILMPTAQASATQVHRDN